MLTSTHARSAVTALAALVSVVVVMKLPPDIGEALLGPYKLSLHTLLEMVAIMIGALAVIVSWHTFKRTKDHSGDVLIGGFLAVAICDVLHVLTFDGMPAFPIEVGVERAIYFWLVSRTLEVLTIAALVFNLAPRLPRARFLQGGIAVSVVATVIGTWALDWLPRTFVPGQGVTPFKTGYEVVLIIGNIALAAFLWWRGWRNRSVRDTTLALSCLLMGLGGVAFTSYKAPSDIQNLAGHLYKVAAYALLFHTTFVASFREPYEALQASEAQVRENQSRMRSLGANLPTTVLYQFYLKPNGETGFSHVSPSIFRVLGIRIPDARRNPNLLNELVHPDDLATVHRAAARSARRLDKFDVHCRFRLPVGLTRHVHLVAQPRRQDDNRIVWDGVLTDVTERVEALETQRLLEAHLADAQKLESVGTLASGIAHDFNNAIATIMGNTQLAIQDAKDGAVGEVITSLEQIHKASAQAKGLVQQILSFSRREAPDRRPQLLLPVLRESISLLRSTLPASVKFHEMVEAPTAKALINKIQIEQVLLNLCTNAWHAMVDSAGDISVGITVIDLPRSEATAMGLQPGPHARIWVEDNGSGMTEEVRRRVFEPFFTTKRKGKGTGLGLSVVHRIIRAHDGAITVNSRPGHGSRFDITLPLLEQTVEMTSLPLQNAPIVCALGAGERVLLVDDNESLGLAAQRLLERHGYEVTFFSDPEKALGAFAMSPARFDVLVTDFNMPQQTGVQLAEGIRQIKAGMPCILLSGFIDDELEAAARYSGVTKVLGKTLAVEDLPRLIRETLMVSQSAQQETRDMQEAAWST